MEHSLQSVQAESHGNSPAQLVNTGKGPAQPERLSSLRAYSPALLLNNSTVAWTGQGAQPKTLRSDAAEPEASADQGALNRGHAHP